MSPDSNNKLVGAWEEHAGFTVYFKNNVCNSFDTFSQQIQLWTFMQHHYTIVLSISWHNFLKNVCLLRSVPLLLHGSFVQFICYLERGINLYKSWDKSYQSMGNYNFILFCVGLISSFPVITYFLKDLEN